MTDFERSFLTAATFVLMGFLILLLFIKIEALKREIRIYEEYQQFRIEKKF